MYKEQIYKEGLQTLIDTYCSFSALGELEDDKEKKESVNHVICEIKEVIINAFALDYRLPQEEQEEEDD
jgi:hypothetical protein